MEAWTDIDYMEVPAGTKRRTVIDRALAEVDFGLEPGERGLLRVIPKADTEPTTVTFDAPAPQLRIG